MKKYFVLFFFAADSEAILAITGALKLSKK